jgi:hypothetical protein
MKLTTEAEIKQIIEIVDKETGQKNFLIEEDGEWIQITKEKYYQILQGDKNGEQ